MIYLDTSVALAALLSESKRPSRAFRRRELVSGSLLRYELKVRINAHGLGTAAHAATQALLDGVSMTPLGPPVLERASQPFPVAVRTLDALHLATMDFLREHGQTIALATHDRRLGNAAELLGFALAKV